MDEIVLKYIGDGSACLVGVPMRDLTDEDIKRSPFQERDILATKLFEKAFAAVEASPEVKEEGED